MELFSWLTFAVVLADLVRQRRRPDWPLLVPIVILVVSVLISLLINPALKPFLDQFGFMRWVFLFYAYYWALQVVWEDAFVMRLLTLWNVMLAAAGAYALAQCFFAVDPIHPGIQVVQFERWGEYKETGYFAMKATGFFSMSLTYAYVHGQSLLAVGRPSFRTWLRPWAWGARLLAVGGIFASMSRGAWIGLVASALISLVARLRKRWWVVIGVAVAGIAALILSHIHLDHSSVTRFDIWRAYWAMFLDHPFFGIGLLQGDKLLPEYYQRLGIVQPFVSHAHNVYLQWLAGAGVFAFAAYVWLCASMLRRAWSIRLHSPWGWSLLLAQLFVHIGAFTECNFFDAEVLHMTVFLWALTLVQEKITNKL